MGVKISLSLVKPEEEDLEAKAKEFAEAQKKKYGEIDPFFHEFDFNKDGSLDEREFKEAVRSYMRVHPEKEKDLNELLNNLEVGVNNPIVLEDFRKIMMIYLCEEMSLENMIDVFKCLDKNLEGQIGANEVKHVFSKLGLNLSIEEARELIGEADTDGDEVMDFEEFLKIMIAK